MTISTVRHNSTTRVTDVSFVSMTGVKTEKSWPYDKVNEHNIREFLSGVHAQTAFPKLDADDRELFISGTGVEEWDNMFA